MIDTSKSRLEYIGATVTIGDDGPFTDCDVEVGIERHIEFGRIIQRDATFEIEFPFPDPKLDVFDENDVPKVIEIIVECDSHMLHLNDSLVTTNVEGNFIKGVTAMPNKLQ